MYCFIPAAGFGTRMKELTKSCPKPLLRVSGKSLLDISIEFASSLGVNRFIINTHYLQDQIVNHLGSHSDREIHISREEEKILGTAGGIKKGIHGIFSSGNFLILNPDVIFYPAKDFQLDFDFDGDILLYLAKAGPESGNTSLSLKEGKVYFEEGGVYYTGLSIMKPNVLEKVQMGEFFDLSLIYREYSKNGKLFGKMFPGEVIDLGDREKFIQNQNITLPAYARD